MRFGIASTAVLTLLLQGCVSLTDRPSPDESPAVRVDEPAALEPAEQPPETDEQAVAPESASRSESAVLEEPAASDTLDPVPDRLPVATADTVEPEPSEVDRAAPPEPVAAPDESPTAPAQTADAAPASPPPTSRSEQPAPAVEQTYDLSGRIELVGGDAAIDEAVVYFIPESSDASRSTSAVPEFEIVTRNKALSPTVMAVPRGALVSFPNEDPILHNLFSVSPDNGFDLGIYGPGEAPSVTFEETGVVNIYCNVHHDMHAHVLVIDSPWQTRPVSDGRFRIEGLPAGPGELHVWHRQTERWSRPLRLPADAPVRISMEVTKPRLPPHRDKAGQPYNRRDRDPYR